MRTWTWILLLLAIAAAAAFGWHWVAADPGYVLIRLRGVRTETSVVFAVVVLLLLWALLSFGLRLLRWPTRAWSRRVQARGRLRLANGLTALAEGRHALAERELAKAANQTQLRGPALLAEAWAAHARGAEARAGELLDAASAYSEPAAQAVHAQLLIARGDHAAALALLKPAATAGTLSPSGWRSLIEAALASGDTQAALDALPPLARSQSLAPDAQARLQQRVWSAALADASDSNELNARWNAASRAQHRQPELIAAFARRAGQLGQTLAAMDAVEAAQRHGWNEELAAIYGALGPGELAARTRTAEAWLATAPNSPALLTTLGQLCAQQSLWGKGEQYLRRALANGESAQAWETLGDCCRGDGDAAAAATCYANALRLGRGQASEPLANHGALAADDTRALGFEERNEHGVPRLPGSNSA